MGWQEVDVTTSFYAALVWITNDCPFVFRRGRWWYSCCLLTVCWCCFNFFLQFIFTSKSPPLCCSLNSHPYLSILFLNTPSSFILSSCSTSAPGHHVNYTTALVLLASPRFSLVLSPSLLWLLCCQYFARVCSHSWREEGVCTGA